MNDKTIQADKHPFIKRVFSLVPQLEIDKAGVLKLIAEKSGVGIRLIQRIVSGKQKNFSSEDAVLIARAISELSGQKCNAEDIIQLPQNGVSVSRKFGFVK